MNRDTPHPKGTYVLTDNYYIHLVEGMTPAQVDIEYPNVLVTIAEFAYKSAMKQAREHAGDEDAYFGITDTDLIQYLGDTKLAQAEMLYHGITHQFRLNDISQWA